MTIIEKLQANGIRRSAAPRPAFAIAPPVASGWPRPTANGSRTSRSRRRGARSPSIPAAASAVQAVGKDAAGRCSTSITKAKWRAASGRSRSGWCASPPPCRACAASSSRHLALPGIPREKVLAGIARILATSFLRPAARTMWTRTAVMAFATLRRRHVSVIGRSDPLRLRGQVRAAPAARAARSAAGPAGAGAAPLSGEVFKYRAADRHTGPTCGASTSTPT